MKPLKVALAAACAVVVGWAFTASADTLPTSAYVRRNLAVMYDARENPAAAAGLVNLGSAGSSYDLTAVGSGDKIDGGWICCDTGWAMSGALPEASRVMGAGYTGEYVGQQTGGSGGGGYCTVISTMAIEGASSSGAQDIAIMLGSVSKDAAGMYVTGLSSGWTYYRQTTTKGCVGSALATRSGVVDANPKHTTSCFENGALLVRENLTSGSAAVNKGIARVTLGNLRKGVAYYWKGRLGCVRIYTDVLSDREIAFNAAVDAVRYRGVSAASAPWPEDIGYRDGRLEASLTITYDESKGTASVGGVKIPSGVPTAVPMVGGEATFTVTPVDGARFDHVEGVSWTMNPTDGTVTVQAAESCALALVFKKDRVIPASAYIQDGLVIQYDGLENAAADGNLGNLGTAGSAFDLSPLTPGKDKVADGWIHTETGWKMETVESAVGGTGYTAEYYGRQTGQGATLDAYLVIGTSIGLAGNEYIPIEIGSAGKDSTGMRIGGHTLTWNTYLYKPTGTIASSVAGTRTGTVANDTQVIAYYENGRLIGAEGKAGPTAYEIKRVYLGDLRIGTGRYWIGDLGSVRIYNRVLTPTEIAANAALDKLRFADVEPEELGYRWNSDEGKLQYRVRVTGDELGGTFSVAGGEPTAGVSEAWVDIDTPTVSIVATPAPGYVFCGWTGDTDDFTFDQYRSPSIAVADRVRTLQAEFREEGANVHTVPGDFSSLAAALASPLVKDGDTIRLADGTHAFAQEATVDGYTYLAKIDRFVTVRGSSPDNAVLDCGGGGGLYIDHPAALVEGVTIQNFQRTSSTFALDFQRGVVSNACVSGRSGQCMKVEEDHIPAIRSFEGAVFEDCVITNVNKEHWDSSGIVQAKGTTFRRTTFYGNAAFSYIMQVAALNGVRTRVEGCTFAKNSDYYRPMIFGSAVDVVNCVFYGNTGSNAGAGLDLSGICTFDRCVVTNNTLNGSCPLVLCNASSKVYATNCLFAANTIANWGAFKLDGKDVRLELVNCTVAANKTTSATYCGGITGDGVSDGRATVRFLNTAFWNNTANGVVKNFLDSYLYTDFDFDNSCFTGIVPTSGAGNTASDPDFVDAAGGDYRLGENSSCIDTGADLPEVPVDLDGRERPIDGTGGTNPKWDIGCYEAAAREIPVQCSLKVLGSEGTWPCPMTQTVTVVGSRLTGLSYEWLAIRMENGVPVTNRQVTAVAENVFEGLPVGVYSFVCTVSNDRGDAASSRVDDAFTTLVGTCYVSNEGSDTFPYTNAAMAARNLSSAVSVASERIVIAPGEYQFDHYVDEQTGYDTMGAVYRAVAIEAGGTAEDVVLDCSGKGGLILANAGASLHGVTFRNYQTVQSAPVLYLKSGTASDIVVSGGGVALKGGECVYIGELAEVENLVVTNHRARAVNAVGGTLRKALIRDCQAGSSPVVSTSKSTHDIGSALEDVEVRACRTTSADIFALGYCDAVRCTFADNTNANKNAYCVSLDMSRLSDSRIVRNSAQCAVAVKTEWMTSYSMWLRNCLVAENQTTSRAAVTVPTTCQYFLLENCTVIGNAADTAPAGGTQLAYSSYANHLKMVNCIIWGNTTGGAPADVAPGGNDFIYQNCCFREAADEDFVTSASCKDNLACDAGVKRNGKLKRLSPCRDAGQVLSWHATGHDIDGNPRVLDAEKGGRVDIGCYENPPGPGLAIFVR